MQQTIHNMFQFRAIFVLLASFLFIGGAIGQDIHFTQFYHAPLTTNPSLTGKYEGTFRVGAIIRDQWASVVSNQYITPSFYVDAPVRGFRKSDWIGLGAVVVHDRAGTVALTNTTVMGNLAYHIGLGNTTISIGGQGGIVRRDVDLSNAEGLTDLNNNAAITGELQNLEEDNITFADFSAGVSLLSKLSEAFDFNAGFSMQHLSEPNYSLYTTTAAAGLPDGDLKLGRHMLAHTQLNWHMAPKWTLSPNFLYQTLQGADEALFQTLAGYHFTPEKDVTLNFGAGYRFGDAVPLLVGFDYKGFRMGLAYDVNISELAEVSSNRGGFELGLSYIAKIRKPVVVKPIIFCPRF